MTPIREKNNSHHDELPQIQAAMLQEVNTALEHLRREAFIRLVGQPEGRRIDGNRHLCVAFIPTKKQYVL